MGLVVRILREAMLLIMLRAIDILSFSFYFYVLDYIYISIKVPVSM